MVELNNDRSETIVKEVFSFNNEVFPKIEEIKTDLTVLLEKGRKFVVASQQNLTNTNISGIPVEFKSIQKEYITYNKKPSDIPNRR